jgi:hypothetical protein
LRPIRVTPTPARPINPSTIQCQAGVGVDKIVEVMLPGVRLRKSWGYVGKQETDVIDTLQLGARAKVLAGPAKVDGLCWWLLDQQGRQGWSADRSQDGTALLTAVP